MTCCSIKKKSRRVSAPKAPAVRVAGAIDPEVLATVRDVKEADDEAETKRLDAEDTFERAERTMSTAGAREGARKALETYDLHEKAIRKAEAATRVSKATV